MLETSGRLTLSKISRKEITVPCTARMIAGMTHSIITAE
jgi:hypothetical protein